MTEIIVKVFGDNEAVGKYYPEKNKHDYSSVCHQFRTVEAKNVEEAVEKAREYYESLFFNPMAVEIESVGLLGRHYKLKAMSYVENSYKSGGIEDI